MACKGKIKKVVAGGRGTYQKISWDGDCPGGGNCQWKLSTDHHGSTREWCGCDPTEPSDCHIVLYTPGTGVPGSEIEVVCAGSCNGDECQLKEVSRGKGEAGEVFELTCECV